MTTMVDLTAIKPMLASPQGKADLATLAGSHVFDIKLDGVRAIALWDGGSLTLRNRSGIDVTHRFPDIAASWPFPDFREVLVLDGEIVARSGSFQDTARRDKQNKPADVAKWMHQIPVDFIAFDVLARGSDIRSRAWLDRRKVLDALEFGVEGPWTRSVYSPDPDFFQQVKSLGMEGVIAKRVRSSYRAGRFSDWVKFKCVRSLTCVATGYEPGTGARAHFGAMFLAVIDPTGKPVSVGRVGTGMTASEITMLKGELDAGRCVVVEIECLNVSKDGSLRFPVYKGVRTDLSVADATLAQLDGIPRM